MQMIIMMSGVYYYYYCSLFDCRLIAFVRLWLRFRLLFLSTLVIMVFVIIFFIMFVANSSTVTSSSLLMIFFCLYCYYPQNPCFSYVYLCWFVIDFINKFFCLFGHVHFPPMNFVNFIILVVLLTFHVFNVFYSNFLHYRPEQQHSSFPSTIVTLRYTP